MTSDEQTVQGASTEQHISGLEEEGTFITDEPPTSKTPANGSSNAGINRLKANRQDPEPEKRDRP
jgi:hypothetical protein